jgi:hypothetical protein
MQPLLYILISSGCLSIFYLAYRLIFKNEANFSQLRVYLLGSVVLSLLVPLNPLVVDLGYSLSGGARKTTTVAQPTNRDTANQLSIDALLRLAAERNSAKIAVDWRRMAVIVYAAVSLLLLLRIMFQLGFLLIQYLKSEKVKYGAYIILYNGRFKSTFSFFRLIFVPAGFSSEEDLGRILAHERIHVQQYHSFDLVMMEVLAAIMWFNPLVWKLKNTMQLVHEYLADEGALKTGIDKLQYKELLINQIAEEGLISLSSSFNNSLIKKRMMMMTENKMYRKSRYKITALIPLSAMLMLVIACVNGLFAESLQAGVAAQRSSLNAKAGEELYAASVAEAGDTVKKTVVKIIRKVPESEDMVSETVHITTADDSITEVRIVKDVDIDMETEITTGVHIDEDMVEHIETTIEHDSAGQKVIKKETIVIRHNGDKQHADKADISNTLVIVDGVEQPNSNGLTDIDPDQIERVDVIKDKTMMKKYTTKDYEGVIVITTKSSGKK